MSDPNSPQDGLLYDLGQARMNFLEQLSSLSRDIPRSQELQEVGDDVWSHWIKVAFAGGQNAGIYDTESDLVQSIPQSCKPLLGQDVVADDSFFYDFAYDFANGPLTKLVTKMSGLETERAKATFECLSLRAAEYFGALYDQEVAGPSQPRLFSSRPEIQLEIGQAGNPIIVCANAVGAVAVEGCVSRAVVIGSGLAGPWFAENVDLDDLSFINSGTSAKFLNLWNVMRREFHPEGRNRDQPHAWTIMITE